MSGIEVDQAALGTRAGSESVAFTVFVEVSLLKCVVWKTV